MENQEPGFLIGLDFGSESARGILIDAQSGMALQSHVHPYRHGIMDRSLPDGTPLPPGFVLQDASDYTEACEAILAALGRDRRILSIGLGFTASSPLPARADGTPLSVSHPGEPHAYVKLYKHAAPQTFVDRINRQAAAHLAHFGGRVSGEWLLAKAVQMQEEAPHLWSETARFIEAGDWIVWQLAGVEKRSLGFAAFKAQYSVDLGYPDHLVPGLRERLARPSPVGTPAGDLSAEWRERTGIRGPCTIAVAVIDSHVVLPAIGAVTSGSLVGALGTSAAWLFLSKDHRPLPPGIEGMALDASLPDHWCYEAGQASFGDMLGWFVRTFPRGKDAEASFAAYNSEAAVLDPEDLTLVALDWWNGNRVPHADSDLSGVVLGLTRKTTPVEIYRALLESLCFGARQVADLFANGGFALDRITLTSGLADSNPFLIQMMADVFERPVDVPEIAHATATGAAIHGAVAAGVSADFAEGASRFGARTLRSYLPGETPGKTPGKTIDGYRHRYGIYRDLSGNDALRQAVARLRKT